MKKTWAIRKDAEAVSPVIATILMVAITVVLAAVLYVMVLGFGTGGGSTPKLQITRENLGNGYKFSLTTPTATVAWTDVTVILQVGATSATWTNLLKASLTGTPPVVQQCGAQGGYYLNVTDMTGEGDISDGDYFTITGTFVSGSYTLTMTHETIKGTMGTNSWSQV